MKKVDGEDTTFAGSQEEWEIFILRGDSMTRAGSRKRSSVRAVGCTDRPLRRNLLRDMGFQAISWEALAIKWELDINQAMITLQMRCQYTRKTEGLDWNTAEHCEGTCAKGVCRWTPVSRSWGGTGDRATCSTNRLKFRTYEEGT